MKRGCFSEKPIVSLLIQHLMKRKVEAAEINFFSLESICWGSF